ncbi:MAG: anhydro-N-acetylmuramic acid kinase [Pirellulaceae bacterium]|nr:anhydro-N-acetylmuramic acid kinase [Pirellulaceae bacterium]
MTASARNALPLERHQAADSGSRPIRYFIGLELIHSRLEIEAALVRVTGQGLSADLQVIDTVTTQDQRIELALSVGENQQTTSEAALFNEAAQSAYLTEAAADLVHSITARFKLDDGLILACVLHNFGIWFNDPVDGYHYLPRCDTSLLSKITGLTIIDDLPGRDRAYGGHGGPVEAIGIWMLLADRGQIPGRRIRAVVQFDTTLRLLLLPPRQPLQIPNHLICHELGPGQSLLDQILLELVDESVSDPYGKLAVQGRHRPTLLQRWEQLFNETSSNWSPHGPATDPWIQVLRDWSQTQSISLHDALCTAIQMLTGRLAQHVKHELPRSQPVGQIILAGAGHTNAFFVRELQQRLPEVEIAFLEPDKILPTPSLGAAAAAVLGQLHLDQIPGNSPALTGTDVPRVLGRLTPGNPANWHEVLANLAKTLPAKLPLRSAI